MQTIRTILASALVRLAAAVLPPAQADKLREAAKPILQPTGRGGPGAPE